MDYMMSEKIVFSLSLPLYQWLLVLELFLVRWIDEWVVEAAVNIDINVFDGKNHIHEVWMVD